MRFELSSFDFRSIHSSPLAPSPAPFKFPFNYFRVVFTKIEGGSKRTNEEKHVIVMEQRLVLEKDANL